MLDTTLPGLRIELPAAEASLDPATLFATPPREIWLEIGFGGGEHLAAQAAANPGFGLIGCEPYENGVVALLGHIRDRRLANIRIWNDDARALLARLTPSSITRVFVLFPDPWPKARHHKRRLIQAPFLDALARVMKPGGELRLASDHAEYVDWMLERVPAHPAFQWTETAIEACRTRSADWPETRYESWSIGEGRRPAYLRFVRR